MKLSELEVGKTYKCTLSGKDMLVTKIKKPELNAKGEETMKEVTAGKYVTMNGETPVFNYDELYDGQLKEIND